MKAKTLLSWALLGAFIAMAAPCTVFAQGPGAPGAVTFTQQQLDQMLAPIALYPDSLLAQILIAATYPDQVMDADRWMKAHQGLQGEALNAELDRMSWDLSVKALAPFPQVLDMMAQEPDWTQKLGEAFLADQARVMDSIQKLRRRAAQAGNLRSTEQQRVVERTDYVEIQPVNPEMVYVPRYDPVVVYGSWWWPAYPPFAYYPIWPGPVVFAPVVGVFGFWGAITVGPAWGWGWGSWGWGGHNVYLNVNRNININTRNAGVINGWHNSFRYANAHTMAASGRVGSAAVRSRAFGTSRGITGRGTAAGSRTGVGGRPSSGQVMNQLRGGRTGSTSYRGTSRGSYGTRSRGTSRGSYGSTSRGTSRGSYGTRARGTSRGSYGGTSRGASRGSFGGASRGASRGSFGGASRGAARGASHGGGGSHGGGNNKKR